jgi:hypothetical protein
MAVPRHLEVELVPVFRTVDGALVSTRTASTTHPAWSTHVGSAQNGHEVIPRLRGIQDSGHWRHRQAGTHARSNTEFMALALCWSAILSHSSLRCSERDAIQVGEAGHLTLQLSCFWQESQTRRDI